MRPDEHKKKKSAQYKKKHGLQEKNTQSSGAIRKSNKTSETPKDVKRHQVNCGNEQENEKNETKHEETIPSGFSRRTVESNWEKYEAIEEDSDEEIGTDFNVLLSFAGSSSSHMRLESEKDWENAAVDLSYLSIDCKDLAESLNQLPFAERYKLDELNLNPDILEMISALDKEDFDESQLSENISSTIASEMGFDFSRPEAEGQSTKTETERNTIHEIQTIQKLTGHSYTPEVQLEIDKDIENSSQHSICEELFTDTKLAEVEVSSEATLDEGSQRCVDDTGKSKKQVDFLTTNSSINPLQIQNKTPKDGNPVKTTEVSLEDDLDELLSLPKAEKESCLEPPVSTAMNTAVHDSVKLKEDKEVNNLEDWLDSIL